MTDRTYCSSCGALLPAGAVVCGECGARPMPAAPAPPPAPDEDEEPQLELAPPLDGVLVAPYGRRVVATVIDFVLWGLVTLPLTIGLVLTLLASAAGDSAGVLALVLLFVGAVVAVVHLAVVAFFHGTRAVTPGKKLTGLRLVSRTTGKPLGVLRVIGRCLVFSLGSAVPAVGLVMPFSPLLDGSGRRQGFHDRLLDAVLVDIADGRNPLKPRSDTFDRAPDAEFLPDGPQQVDADTRTRMAPGAPWAPGPPPPAPRSAATVLARLRVDDGRVLPLAGRTLIGRNPAADEGEEVSHLLSVSDPGRSLSKTHLQIDVGDDGVTATDRYSTNGTVLRSDGGRQPLAPGTAITVPSGGVLVVGDRELKVGWERG